METEALNRRICVELRNFLINETGPQGIPCREMKSVVNKGCSVLYVDFLD